MFAVGFPIPVRRHLRIIAEALLARLQTLVRLGGGQFAGTQRSDECLLPPQLPQEHPGQQHDDGRSDRGADAVGPQIAVPIRQHLARREPHGNHEREVADPAEADDPFDPVERRDGLERADALPGGNRHEERTALEGLAEQTVVRRIAGEHM